MTEHKKLHRDKQIKLRFTEKKIGLE